MVRDTEDAWFELSIKVERALEHRSNLAKPSYKRKGLLQLEETCSARVKC